MMSDFNRIQVGSRGLSCQSQLSNSLRIINVGSVKTECPVDIFVVDILINERYVVEVNGSTHYLFHL
jgi:very-short-patch-repair endonuclease